MSPLVITLVVLALLLLAALLSSWRHQQRPRCKVCGQRLGRGEVGAVWRDGQVWHAKCWAVDRDAWHER